MALSNNMFEFITAFITQIQEIEDALFDLRLDRRLTQAEGTQLDNAGTIPNQTRETGQSDANYLIDIYKKIISNTSGGEPDRLIELANWIVGTNVIYSEPRTATVLMDIDTLPSLMSKLLAVKDAKPAGVALEFKYYEDAATVFNTGGEGEYTTVFTGVMTAGTIKGYVNEIEYSQAFSSSMVVTMGLLLVQMRTDVAVDNSSTYTDGTKTMVIIPDLPAPMVVRYDISGATGISAESTTAEYPSDGEGFLEDNYSEITYGYTAGKLAESITLFPDS